MDPEQFDDPYLTLQFSEGISGEKFRTPGRSKPFVVKSVGDERLTIGTASGGRVELRPNVFRTVIKFLKDRDHVGDNWLKVNDMIFQELIRMENARKPCSSYVLPLLEAIGAIEIDRGHPNKIRLADAD